MKHTRLSLGADLTRLGVRAGDVVMVHAALRSAGPIVGGAATVVQALQDVIGDGGTLVAYVDFEPFYEDDEDDPPVFDPRLATAARDHGVLHETLRTWPGALRSRHPDAGVVALGPLADWLTQDHPFHYGYGEGTPLAKVVESRGRVLMLGAPLDTITLLHYAEHRANLPGKRIVRYRRRLAEGWVDFEEFDTSEPVCDFLPLNCFEQIAEAFLASGQGQSGLVGSATSHLFDAKPLVAFAIEWLERAARAADVSGQ